MNKTVIRMGRGAQGIATLALFLFLASFSHATAAGPQAEQVAWRLDVSPAGPFHNNDALTVSASVSNLPVTYTLRVFAQLFGTSAKFPLCDDGIPAGDLAHPSFSGTLAFSNCKIGYPAMLTKGTYLVYGAVFDANGHEITGDGTYWGNDYATGTVARHTFQVIDAISVTEPLQPAYALVPVLREIYVDTEKHPDISDYQDAAGASYEIGTDTTYVAIRVQGAGKGERLAVYLYSEKGQAGALCASEPFDKDHPEAFPVYIDCQIPKDFPAGDYRVDVRLTDAGNQDVGRGGVPARYWGYRDGSYFITLTGGGTAPTPEEKLKQVTGKGWGALYRIRGNLATPSLGTPFKSSLFSELPAPGTVSQIATDLAAEDKSASLIGLTLDVFDKNKTGSLDVACTQSLEAEAGLQGASSDKDCAAAPNYVRCAGQGKDNWLEVRFCSLGKSPGGHVALNVMISSGLHSNSQIYHEATNPPVTLTASAKSQFAFADIQLDSKNTLGKVVLSLPSKPAPSTLLVGNLLPGCVTPTETNFAQNKTDPTKYTLGFKYDPLCQTCADPGKAPIFKVSTPDQAVNGNVEATISCKADNLVAATGKLLQSGDTKSALADYVTAHPLKTRLLVVDDQAAYTSFGYDPAKLRGKQAVSPQDMAQGVSAKAKARQVVLLGDPSFLPTGKLKVGNKELASDDAYVMQDKSGLPKIPVARIQRSNAGQYVSGSEISFLLKQVTIALQDTGIKKPLVVGPQDASLFTAFAQAYFSGKRACNDSDTLCKVAPPNCLVTGSEAAKCSAEKSYIPLLQGASFIAVVPELTDAQGAYSFDGPAKTPNKYYMLLDTTRYNWLSDKAPKPVVLVANQASVVDALKYTVGNGAAAAVILQTGELVNEAPVMKALATAFAPPAGKSKQRFTVGKALVDAKRALKAADNSGALASALSLYGDPYLELPTDLKAAEKKPNWGTQYVPQITVTWYNDQGSVVGTNLLHPELDRLGTVTIPITKTPPAAAKTWQVTQIGLQVTAGANKPVTVSPIKNAKGFPYDANCDNSPTSIQAGGAAASPIDSALIVKYCGPAPKDARGNLMLKIQAALTPFSWPSSPAYCAPATPAGATTGGTTAPAVPAKDTHPWGSTFEVTYSYWTGKALTKTVTHTGTTGADAFDEIEGDSAMPRGITLIVKDANGKKVCENSIEGARAWKGTEPWAGKALAGVSGCYGSPTKVACMGAGRTQAVEILYCGTFKNAQTGITAMTFQTNAYDNACGQLKAGGVNVGSSEVTGTYQH